ncbi:MAG: alpha/beta hydrolase, partial [Saprospiraceae bacterium]|nr:alpha/beta hydrolase [Saprospiraceae bacterium]
MYKIFPILLLFVIKQPIWAQKAPLVAKSTDFSIGETLEFHSTILNEKRVVNIYLPNGYHPDSLKKYPVIYLLDGSVDEDFIHISGLVQFGSFSWINMIPETIVVGIANVDRKRDFTYPTNNQKDKADFPTTGGSEKFIAFVEQELQPLIEKTYKTGSSKTIIGQSLGGLLATEILFKNPNLFDRYIIVSPSLWWDDQSLLKYTPKVFSAPKAIY